MKLLYFAWVRERIGTGQEQVETSAPTILDLIEELRQKWEGYTLAFQDLSQIRVAKDQELCEFDELLEGAVEVAFFPPMTGGE